MYAKYAFMPSGIGAYVAAGPVSGNVPPIVMDLDVTPGVCAAPPNAPGTVSASAATRPTPHTMSLRTDSSLWIPPSSCLSAASVPWARRGR
jgi:hypothetical protein